MTRQIISANQIQLVEETVNKDYPYPSETHKVSGESLIETVKQAIVEIDADINTLDSGLTSVNSSISTINSNISTANTNITGLGNTKQNTAPEAITSISRDGNGRITAVVQPTQQVNTITYDGNGVLQSYRTVTKNAAGANVTHQVTINRDGNGLITSTTVTVV